ncbi:hypothetical protein L1049_018727 [Liquidambar formosana]|uniref:Serine-threonine/tyrosine-protein kinase catalytic domain-containing protein n=1 Tax=Liquidambar formosana TaxID=63359 RepID=A0AAP0RAH0_LIQFO
MNVGSVQQKKATLFGSCQSSPAATAPAKQGKPTSSCQSGVCCRGFYDCMGTNISHNSHQNPSKLEQQVTHLEKEVEKQKELLAMTMVKLGTTQEYLRYCLQTAQQNGFLELIIKNEDDQQDCSLSYDIDNLNSSPRIPTPVPQHADLAALIDKAKMNGWYIDPHEIELQEQVAQGSTANIYRGTWRGVDVAVKCIYPDFFRSNENSIAFFAQELETLSRQRHCFVLQLMGACLDPPDHGWMVTQFLSTTLKEWLHGQDHRRKKRTAPLPPMEERIAMEVAQSGLRPALPEDNGQFGDLIDLICLSWNDNAIMRPSFATITCTLRKIQKRFIENVYLW